MNARQHQTAAMRLHTPALSAVGLALLLTAASGFAQGSFQNLNFEQATIAPTPIGGWVYPADPAQAFPGWTVGGGGDPPYPVVMYNTLSTGAPAVCLMGPNFPNFANYLPLQGSYSVLLYCFMGAPPTLSQTGLVPATAHSISFLVGNGLSDAAVSLNGVNIPVFPASGGRMAGNISAFAGSVATLTFSVAPDRFIDNLLYFDAVQFSPVPEPGALGLSALGALLLGRGVLGRCRG